MKFSLQVTNGKSNARAGIIETPRGNIETPIFMPVGTVASVKGIHGKDLKEEIKAQIILGNTYHLYLRPGVEVMQEAGGLHRFMSWSAPILTDSGGYQVFSLAQNRKLTAEGVKFRSHIDGSYHLFTPENVVEVQRFIGSDIMMALDECTPFPCERKYAEKSLKLTHQWLERGFDQFEKTKPLYDNKQWYFPIVQGSVYGDLREKSAEFVTQLNTGGYAIGGLSVGEPAPVMYEMTALVTAILPEHKPRYLMGVGTPANIVECIARGIDMFDCVMPTRNGRNGMLFTWKGIINIRNEKWKNDFSLIDPEGTAFSDSLYSRAYLRHLFISGEMLGPQIASMHNLAFYLSLVKKARENIIKGTFDVWKEEIVPHLTRRL